MNQEKTLTQNGLTGPHSLLILISVVMIGVSIYLTNHYFETHFPSRLGSDSALCDLSSFFNCDTATTSKASNIFDVPISFFSLMLGILLLAGSIFPSERMEQTNGALVRYNMIACSALFLYSLIVLNSLCPMCTLYYLLSALAFYLFHRYSFARWVPDTKVTSIFVVVVLLASGLVYNKFQEKKEARKGLNKQIVMQYFALQNLGDPIEDSPYKIATLGNKFKDAPIRVSIFSDFQCPFCAKEAKQMNKLAEAYAGKINIQYFFYPLDNTCNNKVKSSFHEFACASAYLAACSESRFKEIHDEIFRRQDELSFEMLEKMAKDYDLLTCYQNKEKKEVVLKAMDIANNYNIKSTPTLILNGKKIEGAISNDQFKAIFEAILER